MVIAKGEHWLDFQHTAVLKHDSWRKRIGQSDDLTTNARLIKAGLIDEFDQAAKNGDEKRIAELLLKVEMTRDQAESVARIVIENPKRFGYERGNGLVSFSL